ncbi:MAG: hypothetical protein JSV62_16180 [Promethearchaeota archaeon]|nr:MAG: hypothetical protein JSV62_16180 [Candidatus Lokiarchaeota archaeon]
MNEIENEKRIESEKSEIQEKKRRKPEREQRKTQGQIIQETLGLKAEDLQSIEKKLFIVRFLDYYCEETLDFIFKDNTLNQYLKQTTTYMDTFGDGREEDRILKQSFESKSIVDIISKLKLKAEELAISKGIKTSMDKRLRRLTLIITLPLFAVVFGLAFIPINTLFLFPVLCIFCMLPQLIKGRVVKKWYAFKDQNKNEIYVEYREDILILKNFASEILDNIRTRLLELRIPLQLIKFILHSRDYENLKLLTHKNVRGTSQYYYTFEYPADVESFPIPPELQQYDQPIFPEKRKAAKMEKNFIVLSEMKGREGVIDYFVPTLQYKLAEKINEMLNNSEFTKAPDNLTTIIPNYSKDMAIYCVCGEVVEVSNIQICTWKDQFKFYLFEGEKCKCGEIVYAISVMDETAEIPEELKEIFLN